MNWTECAVALGELVPWERNPKRISKASAKRMLDFWQRIGQFQTVAIGPGGEVYDGHQRLSVLKAAFGKAYVVKALRSERALTEAEREELFAQAHYGTVGELNWDMLAGFDTDLLTNAGFDADLLKTLNDDAANLALMLTAEVEVFGDTSTDRDGQGVSSIWDSVKNAESGKVIIGDIESRLPLDIIDLLRQCLQNAYELSETPYNETLEAIVVAGVRAVEGSDS